MTGGQGAGIKNQMLRVIMFAVLAHLGALLIPMAAQAALNARTNPNCTLVSRTCVDHTSRFIAGQWVWRSCWRWRDKYDCAGSVVDTCQPYVNRGCAQIGSVCTSRMSSGACRVFTFTYRCLESRGSAFDTCTPWRKPACHQISQQNCNLAWCVNIRNGGGAATQHAYSCLVHKGSNSNTCAAYASRGCQQLFAQTTVTHQPPKITITHKTYHCLDRPGAAFNNCQSFISKGCKQNRTTTTYQPPGGVTHTNTYRCLDRPGAAFNNCQSFISKGCKQIGSSCIYHKPSGVCGTLDKTFKCLSKKGTSTTRKICKSAMCVNGNCFNMNSPPSTDFLPAVAKLNIATAAGKSLSASGGVSIFKGTAQHCNKTIFGLKNCCKHTPSKSCPASAIALDNTRQARQGIFIGTFCANKAVFGACLRKQEVWCAFPSKLARIIQKAGRAQLGISWGVPKGPNCRGFTPLELQRIDFSKIDLSELYADILAKMKPMQAGSLGNRLSGHIKNYFNSGATTGGRIGP